jgi:hypothetical protein
MNKQDVLDKFPSTMHNGINALIEFLGEKKVEKTDSEPKKFEVKNDTINQVEPETTKKGKSSKKD